MCADIGRVCDRGAGGTVKYADEISRALAPVVVEGRVALCCAAMVTLYFNDGYTGDKRRALLELVDEYLGWAGARLQWWFTEGRRFSRVSGLKSMDMSAYLLTSKYEQPDSDLKWSFMWHGGVHSEDASEIRLEGLGASRMECERHGGLSYVRASFPIDSHLHFLHDTARRWATRLEAIHGYGGIAMIASPDDELASVSEGLFVARGDRFPGLDVDYPAEHAVDEERDQGRQLADRSRRRVREQARRCRLDTAGAGYSVQPDTLSSRNHHQGGRGA